MAERTINPRSVRFSDASWYRPNIDVMVGGAGGIGSWLSLFLARQECNIYLYDDDVIDETNLGGQLYASNHIGLSKADATAEVVNSFTGKLIDKLGRYTPKSMTGPVVFACFDNMASRKLMFEDWLDCPKRQIFIDGRMLAENFQVIAVTADTIDRYAKEELFEDSEVEEERCSMKATSHCGAMIASYMVAVFNNYVANFIEKGNYREVPFKMYYDLPTLTNTIEL